MHLQHEIRQKNKERIARQLRIIAPDCSEGHVDMIANKPDPQQALQQLINEDMPEGKN